MADEARHCPDCGTEVAAAFNFCPSCGISLPALVAPDPLPHAVAEAALPPLAQPDGDVAARSWRAERRLVSVVFVDLVGFTTMSERLDPEDVREVQSRYFEVARSTVARYGGTLEKFIGDAVMAVWGSPLARENDAERAVRAALEIVAAVGAMGAAALHDATMAARAAVTTGEAAVSFDIDGEGMVTGDMVNTASRLQEAARPGTVLVDGATRRAVGAAIAFEDAGERSLKGRSAAVSAWRAVEASAPDRTDSVAGHRGPFIGRAAELADLQQLAGSVVHGRTTVLVSISGVAGIGKSRLVRELERDAREGRESLRWYRGRPPRWGEGTAFAPLAEMVRRLLGLARGDPEEVVRRTLAAELDRLVPDPDERAWIGARVGALLGAPGEAPGEAAGDREELFAAWRRFLEAEADAAPIALVFEDLQWADPDTFDFIDYLTTWSHRHPILVLAIARPELIERRPTWGAGVPQFRSMHLDRLADEEIDALLAALAPQLAPAVAASVRQRAEGVPLYAVEIARMLTESGGPTAAGADVPESLHALLAARIDSLPVEERTVLLMAAVLGRRFRQESLAALAGMPRAELGARIGTLIRREFLTVDDEPTSAGRGQLTFVQDLMREVAYATLSRRDRRRHHEAVIAHLAAEDDPRAIEPIAEHLVAAHAAVGADRAEADALARRATGALREAADHAESQHAPHRALVHLERALALAEDAATRAPLAEAAASAARSAARFGVAEAHLRTAIDAREELGDRVASARNRASLAGVLLQAQRSDTAVAELEAAWASYAEVGGQDAVIGQLAAQLARASMLRQDTAAATEWAARAIAAADRDGSDEGRAAALDARVSLGTALAQGDRREEGMAELAAAVDGAADARLTAIELRARTNLAFLTAADDPGAGSEIARRGIELAQQVGSREWLLQLLDIGGILAVDTGDWEWALARLQDALAGDLPTPYRLDFAATTTVIHALRGDPEPLAVLDRIGEHEPDLDAHAFGWSRLARATAAFVAGDMPAALGLAERVAQDTIGFDRAEALALAGRVAAWSGDRAAVARTRAELDAEPRWGRATEARLLTLAAAADPDAAAGAWDAPIGLWRELGLPYREALCLADRWVLRGDEADRDAAIARLEELGAAALIGLVAERRVSAGQVPERPTA